MRPIISNIIPAIKRRHFEWHDKSDWLKREPASSTFLKEGSLPNESNGEETGHDISVELTLHILKKIIGATPLQFLNIRLWNGLYWPDQTPKPATLVLNRPSALREMFENCSEIAIGEAYIHEAFDIEGDIVAAFELADILSDQTWGWTKNLAIASLIHRLPDPQSGKGICPSRKVHLNGAKNSIPRDRNAVQFHYDISNDFYALWLDPRMVYSCAYFENPEMDLENAQLRKLDHICCKLNLQPGEHLLDIGCGWAGLLIHAAIKYGVKADGITLSQKQLEWAQSLVEKGRLQDRVTVRLLDYRELNDCQLYDKVVSVGMVEHVGRQNLGVYFQQAAKLLKPGGLFLNHGIGLGPVSRLNNGESFIEHYVFPDTDLVPIGQMLEAAGPASLEIRDVESLREHYALTLRHWVARLEAKHSEIVHETDEATYRIWRLYMAGSAHGFSRGHLSIYQTLLAKLMPTGNSHAPMTRKEWYRS